jgi:hypothetical protein
MPREEPSRKRLGPKRGTPTRRHVTPQQAGCKRTEPYRRLVLYMVARRCSAATNIYLFRGWLYRGQRPTRIARTLNRAWASIFSSGIAPDYLTTLEVTGRKSGRCDLVPSSRHRPRRAAVLGVHARKPLAMGKESGSSKRRPRGRSTRRSSRDQRAPILRAYLQRAPGARRHAPVNKDAALAEFHKVATEFPVFRLASLRAVLPTQPGGDRVRS